MKYPYHSTAAQEGQTPQQIAAWSLSLRQWHRRLAPFFARPEVLEHALLYLHAILSDIPRKNGWQIAEHARQLRPYGMQRLLSRAVWDQDAVRDALRRFVCQTLLADHPTPALDAAPFPVLVLDESGFPKRGCHSAGVGSQYCGISGRVENCQVGVFLTYVTERGHALIDRELYLPQDWCADALRRQAVHIPETVRFATKPELAQRMLARALSAGVPSRWVVADTVYGHSTDLRLFLQEHGYAYALAVPSIEVVCVQTHDGPLLADVASIAQHVAAKEWQCLSMSQGTKGERLFDWALVPWLQGGAVDGRHWLVIRRCLDDPAELASYLVWAPLDTPLSIMVQAVGVRWRIEEDLEATKDLGLDHYEVRSYLGWYRHSTLVLLAYAFLVGICVQDPQQQGSPQETACGSPLATRGAHPFRSASPLGPPYVAAARLGPVGLWLVAFSTQAPVLGGLLPSSSSQQSRFPLNAGDHLCVCLVSLAWCQQKCWHQAGRFPWTSPGTNPWKTPRTLPGRAIVCLSNTRKELHHDHRVVGRQLSAVVH